MLKQTGYAYNDQTGKNDIPVYHIEGDWYVTEWREILHREPTGMQDTPYFTVLPADEIKSSTPEEIKKAITRVDHMKIHNSLNDTGYAVDLEHLLLKDTKTNVCFSFQYFRPPLNDDVFHIVLKDEMLTYDFNDLPYLSKSGSDDERFDFEDAEYGNELWAIMVAVLMDIAPLHISLDYLIGEELNSLDPDSDFKYDPKEPTDENLAKFYGKGRSTILRWKSGKRDEKEKRLYDAAYHFFLQNRCVQGIPYQSDNFK